MQPFLTAFYKLFVPTAMLLPKFYDFKKRCFWLTFCSFNTICG